MKRLKNSRGQGTVEYILILTLAAAMILGAIYQLNTAFRAWADSYFGDYLACLLETGELPSLGGENTGICASEFQPFSLANGAPPREDGGGGPTPGSADDPEDAIAGSGGGGSASTDSGGPASMGSGSGSRGGVARYRVRSGGSRGGADGESDGKSGGDEIGASAFNEGYQAGRTVRIPIRETESIRRARAREEKKEPTKTKVQTSVGDGEREGAPRLIKVVARQPTAEDDEGGFEFTIGNLLRYLIILAIIIAMVIFIGGQALQVAKSTDANS